MREKIDDLERFCLNSSSTLFTVSDVTREALIRKGIAASRITTVPNSAADVFFGNGRSGPGANEDCSGFPDRLGEGRWFGYVGSIHPWQGVELLVDAWAEVAGEWPGVGLLIISGRRSPAIRRLRRQIRKHGISDRVLLHPPLAPERLAKILPNLEFTCAPLLETARNVVQGCCPIKIVESMAAGTPVLASDLRVTRALIKHGHDGFLARAGEVRDWALALRILLQDREAPRRLGREASRTALARFTYGTMFDRLLTVFQSALAGSGIAFQSDDQIGGDG